MPLRPWYYKTTLVVVATAARRASGFSQQTTSQGSPWVACPPPTAACATSIKDGQTDDWLLRAEVDKVIAQRTYELLVVYDWIAPEHHKQRHQVVHAMGALEAARQLLCAAAFAPCDSKLQGVAHAAAQGWMINSQEPAATAAHTTQDVCAAAVPRASLGRCAAALFDWTEAEYRVAVQPFVDATGVQPDVDASRANARKVPAAVEYPAPIYPPSLSPGQVCEFNNSPLPVFGGEAFGDVTWVDVTNQRTRHLSMVSLLEVLGNGRHFASLHPAGFSHLAVNLGAGDGVCQSGHGHDPANCLFAAGYGGVLLEVSERLWPSLLEEFGHRQPDIQLVFEAAEPASVSGRLARAFAERPGWSVPQEELDLLKIDVDGADCDLTAALAAAGWRPKVWHVEVNPLFPPGIRFQSHAPGPAANLPGLGSAFSRHAGGDARGETSADGDRLLVGCSLQALLDILGPAYVLVQLEFENAVLVRRDLADSLEPWISAHDAQVKWRSGYFCHPLARLRPPHDSDRDSLFLHYDFRLWGDPALTCTVLYNEVESFLRSYAVPGSYQLGPRQDADSSSPPVCAASHAHREASAISVLKQSVWASTSEDPDCKLAWKGKAFEWQTILGNTERLLALWAGATGNLEEFLRSFAEEIAKSFALDRGWTIFKIVAHAECPLGGLVVAAVLRWRCAPGTWEADPRSPATKRLFAAMRKQLPVLGTEPRTSVRSGRPAGLGCEEMLGRYLEIALHRIDLSMAFKSRWPVFELLTAHHAESLTWPRGYP